MLTTANPTMAQDPQTSDSKLLRYISNGINTLLIAALIYLGATVQANSSTLVRVEEGLKNLTKISEAMQPKLDAAYDTGKQNSQELTNIRERLDRLEHRQFTNK
jgi:hypothetical protein